MHHFAYRGEALYAEGVPLAHIADQVGTPTYVYSYSTIARHYRVFDEAFADLPHLICYSLKASSNLSVVRSLAGLGAGVDIVSGGELRRALAAGTPPGKIVFSGVGKRGDEIAAALQAGILAFNVESEGELGVIAEVAGQMGQRAPVALRINPDVDARTHPYISTGLKENKFGIPLARARAAYALAVADHRLEVVGLDCHIGSQLTDVAPFRDAIARLAELCHELIRGGLPLRYLDIGGGLGIAYRSEAPPSPTEYARAIREAMAPFAGLGLTLVCEPGRVIVGNAGVLLTRVLYLKEGEGKRFVIVDAAMNDLIRPAFYDAYHALWPLRETAGPKVVADVVGPICESGDFLARDRELQRPTPGDLFAVMSAGAYGFSMSSNYNSRPRAAEVLVRGDRFAVVRRRETIDDLLRGESLSPLAEPGEEETLAVGSG